MTAMLAFCRCGHTRDDHIAIGGCIHLNHDTRNNSKKPEIRAKARKTDELCSCARYAPDTRLTDSEDFVGKVLSKARAKEGWSFEWVEWQEAVQVLRIQLWRTAEKYDSRSHVRFRVYAYLELYNDAIDHIRSERGRHGQHRVFDGRNAELDDFSDEPAHTGRLDGAASRDPADDPDNWATDGAGLLAVADGPRAGDPGRAGRDDAEADERRDRRAGVREAGRARAAAASPRRPAPRPAFVDCAVCGWRTYRQPPNGVPGWHDPDVCGGCSAPLTAEPAAAVEPRP